MHIGSGCVGRLTHSSGISPDLTFIAYRTSKILLDLIKSVNKKWNKREFSAWCVKLHHLHGRPFWKGDSNSLYLHTPFEIGPPDVIFSFERKEVSHYNDVLERNLLKEARLFSVQCQHHGHNNNTMGCIERIECRPEARKCGSGRTVSLGDMLNIHCKKQLNNHHTYITHTLTIC